MQLFQQTCSKEPEWEDTNILFLQVWGYTVHMSLRTSFVSVTVYLGLILRWPSYWNWTLMPCVLNSLIWPEHSYHIHNCIVWSHISDLTQWDWDLIYVLGSIGWQVHIHSMCNIAGVNTPADTPSPWALYGLACGGETVPMFWYIEQEIIHLLI